MPVERDFYDRAGNLFKAELCTIETVGGVPTITKNRDEKCPVGREFRD
jgi:hypothetical protein